MLSPATTRFTLSLPGDLLIRLDRAVSAHRLPSRSHAVVEMIRSGLTEQAARAGRGIFAGTITLIYGNRHGTLRDRLSRIQFTFLKEIVSSQHVFLEDQHSLEVLLVQGPGERLHKLADALRAVKGVSQVKIALTARILPPLH